jgi:hypothetical protein
MIPRQFTALFLVTCSSLVWGADTRSNLEQARTEYRQAVVAHGPGSPEAKNARRNLRATRRTFHSERRERMRDRSRSR